MNMTDEKTTYCLSDKVLFVPKPATCFVCGRASDDDKKGKELSPMKDGESRRFRIMDNEGRKGGSPWAHQKMHKLA